MTDPDGAAERVRAYLNAFPDRPNLGGSVAYGPEFTAANGRPAGVYALDRSDLEELLSDLAIADEHFADRNEEADKAWAHARSAIGRGDALAKAVQLVANQLATAGLHGHAQELCFAIDEYEEQR